MSRRYTMSAVTPGLLDKHINSHGQDNPTWDFELITVLPQMSSTGNYISGYTCLWKITPKPVQIAPGVTRHLDPTFETMPNGEPVASNPEIPNPEVHEVHHTCGWCGTVTLHHCRDGKAI